MFHLINNTGVDQLALLNSNTDRFVIGSSIEDEFLGSDTDTLVKELNLKNVPKTHLYTRRVDWFITEYFPNKLSELAGNPNRFRVFADPEAMVKMIAWWLRQLFPDIDKETFCQFMHINQLARRIGYEGLRLKDYYETQTGWKVFYDQFPVNDTVQAMLQKHRSGVSLEFQLMGVLGGDTPTEETATAIRQQLDTALNEIVGEIHQASHLLFYSYQLENVVNRPVGDVGATRDPITTFEDVTLLNSGLPLTYLLADPATRDDVLNDVRKDIETFGALSLDTDGSRETIDTVVSLAEMYCIDDDAVLVDTYINAFKTTKRPLLLVPVRHIGNVNLNYVYWALRQKDKNGVLPRLAWQ